MNRNPAISVILPVYNAAAYVREAVQSILVQSFTDFELIVIDDGSTDGSGAILRELAAHDARIVLVERPNDGLVSALNEGIKIARAELIARMDADDVSMPERFALQHARMIQEPELAVLGSFFNIIDKDGSIIRLYDDLPLTPAEARSAVGGFLVAHPAVMMRRDAVLKAGGYRKAFSHAEDYDLWLRMSDLGYAIANLPQPLLNYREHGASVSQVYRGEQGRSVTLARLAHRVRRAGLPDPFDGVETIDAELIQTIPAHLRRGVNAELFVHRYSRLSHAGGEGLAAAWRQYLQFDAQAQRNTQMCYFLLRLLKGAVRQRDCHLALRAFARTFRLHPKMICSILWRKFKRILSIRKMLVRQPLRGLPVTGRQKTR